MKNSSVVLVPLFVAVVLAILSAGIAHADTSNFVDNNAGQVYANAPAFTTEQPITIDFDQDGTACSGTADEYTLGISAGSVGYGYPDTTMLVGTTTLVAGHEHYSFLGSDYAATAYDLGYVNLRLRYYSAGTPCDEDHGTGFGEQNWGYIAYHTTASYFRSPGTPGDNLSYLQSTPFTISVSAPNTLADYPVGTAFVQLKIGDYCSAVGTYDSWPTISSQILPEGYYGDATAYFSDTDTVGTNGCMNGSIVGTHSFDDAFRIGNLPPLTPTPINSAEILSLIVKLITSASIVGVTLAFLSAFFGKR